MATVTPARGRSMRRAAPAPWSGMTGKRSTLANGDVVSSTEKASTSGFGCRHDSPAIGKAARRSLDARSMAMQPCACSSLSLALVVDVMPPRPLATSGHGHALPSARAILRALGERRAAWLGQVLLRKRLIIHGHVAGSPIEDAHPRFRAFILPPAPACLEHMLPAPLSTSRSARVLTTPRHACAGEQEAWERRLHF